MRYYSAKGAIVLITIIVLLFATIMSFWVKAYPVAVIMILLTAYMIWMWFDTYYTIENGNLFYKCALLKGTISIIAITEIVKNKKLYSGIKASLSTKGLIIKYNRWDDVYISPKSADEFISELKNINPDIKITE